jgi:hypothetical protein
MPPQNFHIASPLFAILLLAALYTADCQVAIAVSGINRLLWRFGRLLKAFFQISHRYRRHGSLLEKICMMR